MELAVDLHAITVIAASNYQRCITALWRGYYTAEYSDDDRLIFSEYKYLTSHDFWDHFNTERVKGVSFDIRGLTVVPRYQNFLNIFFTILFLILYTIAVNTPNAIGEIDFVEGFLFAFVFGFFFDEISRMYLRSTYVDNVDGK